MVSNITLIKIFLDDYRCPKCSIVGPNPENIQNIRVCKNENCMIRTYATDTVKSVEIAEIPKCPNCRKILGIDRYDKLKCMNKECKVIKIDKDRLTYKS